MSNRAVLSLCLLAALAAPRLAHADPPAGPVAAPPTIQEAYRELMDIQSSKSLPTKYSGPSLHNYATACAKFAHQQPGPSGVILKAAGGDQTLTLAELDAQVCTPLEARAATYEADLKASRQGKKDDLAASYKAAGVGGEKLAFAVKYANELYLPGQQVVKTAADVANGSVFFVLSHSDDEHWTLDRYAFKGNARAGMTTQSFKRQPGSDQYR